jgi:ABC-type multidrug transport system ATPase subunit
MSCLQLDSVALSYSNHVILSDVCMTISKGEIVGLLGRNGSGKSSLLHVLFGVIHQANRHVEIDGEYHHQPYRSKRLFLVPQKGFNVSYLTPHKLAKCFDVEVASILEDELIQRVWNQRFSEMSGGERKYTEILIALYSSRCYVLLDEPFSYLAPVMVERLIERISTVSKSKGILLTDHQYEHVLEVSDRQFILSGGALRPFSTRADLVRHGYLT